MIANVDKHDQCTGHADELLTLDCGAMNGVPSMVVQSRKARIATLLSLARIPSSICGGCV